MSDVSWELSLRADQPIQGCELSPHAFIRVKSNILDNPGKAKVLEANPHVFSYRWSRGPSQRMCSSVHCPRQGSSDPADWSEFSRGGPCLSCSVCLKAGVPRHETLYCSMRYTYTKEIMYNILNTHT